MTDKWCTRVNTIFFTTVAEMVVIEEKIVPCICSYSSCQFGPCSAAVSTICQHIFLRGWPLITVDESLSGGQDLHRTAQVYLITWQASCPCIVKLPTGLKLYNLCPRTRTIVSRFDCVSICCCEGFRALKVTEVTVDTVTWRNITFSFWRDSIPNVASSTCTRTVTILLFCCFTLWPNFMVFIRALPIIIIERS